MNVSDEFYRRIVMAVPEGIWVVDPQGRTIFSNQRMAEILGTDFNSMAEQSCFACVFPDELADAQRHFARALSGDGRPFDFRLRQANGSPIWVSISCMPICDDTGAPVGVLGLFSDISDRKQAEAALRDSEERFRATFFQAAVGIAQTSPQGEWLLLNNRFSEIVGYTQAELRGKTFVDITHPDDREANIVARRQFLAGEISSWSVEKRYIHKNGATVWARVHVSLVRDQHHVPQYFISVVEDVTDRVEAERALRDSERRLALAQSAAHVGTWERDLRTNVKTISGEYAKLYGLAPDHPALTYQEWLSMIHPDDREGLQTLIEESIKQMGSWDTEFRVVWPDGSVHWLLTKGTVCLDDFGQPVRRLGVNLDITDQKRAEEALRRSLDEIAHLNRVASMAELAGSLAHELNQPLAAILLNSQAASRFLNGQPPNLARVGDCLNAITADDERAGEVIKRLRGLLKKGKSQASFVDLNEVVSDAIRLVGSDALLRETRVRIEPHPKLPPVLGDRVQLCQVVLNLLVNGLQAAAEQPPAERWFLVRTAAEGGGVELTVEDSGKGIAEGDLARVFEPFFTTKQEGLGMGLSISRSIVEAHGGRIWAERSAGRGAIFRCSLPMAQQATAESAK